MRATLTIQDHSLRLRDDAGNVWGVGESPPHIKYCDGCLKPVTRYFYCWDSDRSYRVHRCADCVEVVNPFANGGRGEIIGNTHHPE